MNFHRNLRKLFNPPRPAYACRYLPQDGDAAFLAVAKTLMFGEGSAAVTDGRVVRTYTIK